MFVGGCMEMYGWNLKEAMRHTMPQLIMLNHRAWVESERMKKRLDKDRAATSTVRSRKNYPGKPDFSKMTSAEIVSHTLNWE